MKPTPPSVLPEISFDLIEKYSIPAPRYTSYPPATQFHQKGSPVEVLQAIARNNQSSDRGLSLYFHLPFCRSLCWFCGCTTVITKQQERSAAYLKHLEKEVEWMAPRIHPGREVVQLHLGGGTPNFFLPDEIRRLSESCRRRFRFASKLEASAEMDPRELTHDHVKALREAGFNRASFGVQDNDPRVQQAVHRVQPLDLTRRTVAWVREEGFESLNIDLIYGLPLQTVASFEKTLHETLQLKPDRFAVFNYAHVPWIKPAQRVFKAQEMPSPQTKIQILKLIVETLTHAGYHYIGMDHFAREGDELVVAQRNKTLQRNFQGYSTCGTADIYAFGMSSISQIPEAYWQNEKELPAYYQQVGAGSWPLTNRYLLTPDDQIRRETIMRLMCDLGLDYAQMSLKLGIDFARYFESELESLSGLQQDGLIALDATELRVTDTGQLLIRNIATHFDKYFTAQGKELRFSKAI